MDSPQHRVSDSLSRARDVPVARARSVLMVGPHPRMMGGMATVIGGYMDGGLFERITCRFVSTYRDGGYATKALAALDGWTRILYRLCTMDAPLVHIHLGQRASFWRKSAVCLMAKALRRPYLLHVHGSEFMQFHDDECGPRARRFVASILRDAALVLALSDEWRRNLLRICPDANIEVLTNAVPLPAREQLRRRRNDVPTVLILGRLGRRKGTFDLLEAFARIADRHPRARLVCAGDGEIEEARARAERLGIADRVSCPGWLDADAARDALASASIFVLPSYAEGLPMALLEAMSWELPPITSPVGGIPQVIHHGENGILVEPGDIDALAAAQDRLLTDAAERERLGKAARRTVEESFSLEAALERMLQIYRRFGIPLRTATS